MTTLIRICEQRRQSAGHGHVRLRTPWSSSKRRHGLKVPSIRCLERKKCPQSRRKHAAISGRKVNSTIAGNFNSP